MTVNDRTKTTLSSRKSKSFSHHHSLLTQATGTLVHQRSPGKDRGANWCHSGRREPCQEFRKHHPIRTTLRRHRDLNVYAAVMRRIKNVSLRLVPWMNNNSSVVAFGSSASLRGRHIQCNVVDVTWCTEEGAANTWGKPPP